MFNMNFHRRQYTNTYFSIVTFCKENILVRLQCRVIDFGLVYFLFWNMILYLFECTHFECIYLKDYNLTFSLLNAEIEHCASNLYHQKTKSEQNKTVFQKTSFVHWMNEKDQRLYFCHHLVSEFWKKKELSSLYDPNLRIAILKYTIDKCLRSLDRT